MTLRVALPKGRMQASLFKLLDDAGMPVATTARGYRPELRGLNSPDVKILKPQNIVGMLHAGTRDVGFAGADWVSELEVDIVEVLDTGLDKVRIVAAAPTTMLEDGALPARPLVVASEMERLTRRWIDARGRGDSFVRTYGATEVFPPEDADCIVDVAQSGATLVANGLSIVDTLLHSSTRMYASHSAMDDATRRAEIEAIAVLIRSVLDARDRVLLEVNVTGDRLAALSEVLPCMKTPTVAALHDGQGFAVKAAVPRRDLPTLLPIIRARGATDILVMPIQQLVP